MRYRPHQTGGESFQTRAARQRGGDAGYLNGGQHEEQGHQEKDRRQQFGGHKVCGDISGDVFVYLAVEIGRLNHAQNRKQHHRYRIVQTLADPVHAVLPCCRKQHHADEQRADHDGHRQTDLGYDVVGKRHRQHQVAAQKDDQPDFGGNTDFEADAANAAFTVGQRGNLVQ